MKTSRSDVDETRLRLLINADTADLVPIKNHVLGHFTKDVKVPGFRAGKAPIDLIEKNVNQNTFFNEFMEHAVNDLYRQAVQAENIRPVGQPDVKIKKFVPYSDLEVEITIDRISDITLPDYKTIKLPRAKV